MTHVVRYTYNVGRASGSNYTRKGLAFVGQRRIRGEIRAVIACVCHSFDRFLPPPRRGRVDEKRNVFLDVRSPNIGGRALPIFRRTAPPDLCLYSRRTRITFIPRATVRRVFLRNVRRRNSCRDVRIDPFSSPNTRNAGQIGSPAQKPCETQTSGSPANEPHPVPPKERSRHGWLAGQSISE